MLNRKFLKATLSSLITNRAIQWVVDEEEFHDALTAFLNEFTLGPDSHVFANGVGAGNHWTWHPADFLEAILIIGRLFARIRAGWHAHLNETHAAVAG